MSSTESPHPHRLDFASDTVASACPEAIEAIAQANATPFAASYGEDEITARAAAAVERALGLPCAVFFVTSGTAANAAALSLLVDPAQAILCHPLAHIDREEANAPECFTGGAKLLHAEGALGKIDPARAEEILTRGADYHSAEVAAISLTQTTESGTIYQAEEMRAFAALKARFPELKIHVDGARFANAVAATGATPASLLEGVDILTFGASKNGGLPTEAIVCFDPALRSEGRPRHRIKRRLKRLGQVVAKHRFLAAPWLGLLENDIWLRNATNANQRAKELAAGFLAKGYELAMPLESNQIFVKLPSDVAARLESCGWHFYFYRSLGGYRFVCNWNTQTSSIRDLLGDL